MTIAQLLELERKTAQGNGVVFEDTGSDAQNYYKAAAGNDPEINQREQARRTEGEQKAKEEAAKAAETILGLTQPSTYINTALDWNGKEKMSDAASMAVDLALPIVGGIAGSGIKGGVQLIKPTIKNYRAARAISKDIDTGVKGFKFNPVALNESNSRMIDSIERQPIGRTSLAFFERPSKLSNFEKLGIPKQERKQLGSFRSDLNWDAREWFNLRKTLNDEQKYNAFDIMSLQAHLPEYLSIEKLSKNRGNWLKNSDGSSFIGDPRSWVQLQSQNGKLFDQTPIYSGVKTYAINPRYNGHFWGVTGQGKIPAYQARAYAASDNHVLELVTPKYARTYNAGDQAGRVWFDLKNEQNISKTNDLAEWAFKNGYDRININNVLDAGPESGRLSKSKYRIYDSPIDDYFYMSSLPQNDVVVDAGLPRKSIVGNNGNFNIHDKNIYRKYGGSIS